MNKYLILSFLTINFLSLNGANATGNIENLNLGYTAHVIRGFTWAAFSAFQGGRVCEWGVDGYDIPSTYSSLPSCELRFLILNQQGMLQPPKSADYSSTHTMESGDLKVVAGTIAQGFFFTNGVIVQHQNTGKFYFLSCDHQSYTAPTGNGTTADANAALVGFIEFP